MFMGAGRIKKKTKHAEMLSVVHVVMDIKFSSYSVSTNNPFLIVFVHMSISANKYSSELELVVFFNVSYDLVIIATRTCCTSHLSSILSAGKKPRP